MDGRASPAGSFETASFFQTCRGLAIGRCRDVTWQNNSLRFVTSADMDGSTVMGMADVLSQTSLLIAVYHNSYEYDPCLPTVRQACFGAVMYPSISASALGASAVMFRRKRVGVLAKIDSVSRCYNHDMTCLS